MNRCWSRLEPVCALATSRAISSRRLMSVISVRFEASGVMRPARIYDLRSTFASNALAAGVSVFELARVMGTSVSMIERHYGTLIERAGADIARRLTAFEA